ncbi:MAG TPA: hypothetical protein VEA69_01355 [Tepidisphaeraceae bacterium]|nr:hypothetical protein [Tepidisphaeraceae bacterium]
MPETPATTVRAYVIGVLRRQLQREPTEAEIEALYQRIVHLGDGRPIYP